MNKYRIVKLLFASNIMQKKKLVNRYKDKRGYVFNKQIRFFFFVLISFEIAVREKKKKE
jgi:hypothetical protein